MEIYKQVCTAAKTVSVVWCVVTITAVRCLQLLVLDLWLLAAVLSLSAGGLEIHMYSLLTTGRMCVSVQYHDRELLNGELFIMYM